MDSYHKTCPKCKISKSFTEFTKDKHTKDGYRCYCKTCGRTISNNYQKNNKSKINDARKKWVNANIESQREYHRSYKKLRKNTDPLFKLRIDISDLIVKGFKSTNCKKQSKTVDILGCDFQSFKIHIENQFMEGMSWDNRSEWHLDHITPVSWGKTEEEIISLNHYTNFQPLWAIDNMKKGNRYSN